MAVRITKPAFNIREKLSELDRPAGIIGSQVLKCNDLTELSKTVHTGRRNFLRNGAMEVWQRGTSFTNIYNYTADRWQATRYNGTVNQITRNEINGRVADDYGFNWFLKYDFNGTGGGGAAYLNQPLESIDSKKMRGKPVCFSFYAKTSSHHAGKEFRSCISYHKDTSYNDNGMYYFGFKNPTTYKMKGYHHMHELWQRYWVTGIIPFDAEQVGVGLIEADYDNGSIDITGCQLEIGNSPTRFEHLSYAEELHLCRRYYYNLNNAVGGQLRFVGYGGGGTSAGFSLNHNPPMRVTPTGTLTVSSGSLSYNDGIAAYSGNNGGGGWSFNGNRFSCDVNTTTNAANTAIRSKALSIYTGGGGTKIELNAEL